MSEKKEKLKRQLLEQNSQPELHEAEGLVHIEVGLFKLSDIKIDIFKKQIRKKGLKDPKNTVAGLTQDIIDKKYRALKYKPPVITKSLTDEFPYELEVGFNRQSAHMAAGEEYMWCQLVEFVATKKFSKYANARNFKDWENDPDYDNYHKNERTPEDTIEDLSDMVDKGELVCERDAIKKTLIARKITKPSLQKYICDEVLKAKGITSGIVQDYVTDASRNELIAEAKENKKLDIEKETDKHIILKTTLNDSTAAKWSGQKKDFSDYGYKYAKKKIKAFKEGKSVTSIPFAQGCDVNQVKKIRNEYENFDINFEKEIEEMNNIYKSKEYQEWNKNNIIIIPPQIESDEGNFTNVSKKENNK